MNCDKCATPLVSGVCPSCSAVSDATGTFQIEPVLVEVESQAEVQGLRRGEAALVVLRGPQADEVWVLDADQIDIGRSSDSQLFLDDVTVSRRHAILRRSTEGWTVEDLGSLNGTYVDHEQISGEVSLASGAELQVGKFRFRFVSEVKQ